MKTKLLILPALLSIALFTTWCTNIISDSIISDDTNSDINNTGAIVWLWNPASIHCEENSGTLELIFDNWESYGMCHFENWKVCEEREFYRKECSPNTEEEKNLEMEKTKTIDDIVADNEETITNIIENHTSTSWYKEEWLTEADIELMEAIIEKLK